MTDPPVDGERHGVAPKVLTCEASSGVQSLLRAGNKTRYTKFYRKQVRALSDVAERNRGPVSSPVTKQS